jgi:flagellar assembly protein FliH
MSFLEDFGQIDARHVDLDRSAKVGGAERVEFDDGYRAGWEDALAEAAEERSGISRALGERLLELSHSQEAANRAALASLEPLLHELFDKVLPRAADKFFLPVILEEARALLDGAGAQALRVAVCPDEAAAMRALARDAGLDAATIVEDPAMSPSQAMLRHEREERRVDLAEVLARFDDALDEFLTIAKEA